MRRGGLLRTLRSSEAIARKPKATPDQLSALALEAPVCANRANQHVVVIKRGRVGYTVPISSGYACAAEAIPQEFSDDRKILCKPILKAAARNYPGLGRREFGGRPKWRAADAGRAVKARARFNARPGHATGSAATVSPGRACSRSAARPSGRIGIRGPK
jgi:hypothetical protein